MIKEIDKKFIKAMSDKIHDILFIKMIFRGYKRDEDKQKMIDFLESRDRLTRGQILLADLEINDWQYKHL